jgi:hypothetical protein
MSHGARVAGKTMRLVAVDVTTTTTETEPAELLSMATAGKIHGASGAMETMPITAKTATITMLQVRVAQIARKKIRKAYITTRTSLTLSSME